MNLLRQLITPFYGYRTGKARRRTDKVRDDMATVRRARSERKRIKDLKKAGILK